MSGGSLNYFYEDLAEHVGDLGDRELDDLVSDLSKLFHDREWYLSSDTGRADWAVARAKFKDKWFTEAGRKERIEQYMDDLKDEVLKSFGLSDKYCVNCAHFHPDEDGPYGSCSETRHCLMHERDACRKFMRRGDPGACAGVLFPDQDQNSGE